MNYIHKIKWIVAIVILLMFAGYIFTIFNGSPIERIIFKNKASKYLNEKYPFKTEIDDVYYSFKSSDFTIYAHIRNKPKIKFSITQNENKKELQDNLISSVWGNDLETELIPFTNTLFSDVKVIATVWNTHISDKYIYKSNIPNLTEAIENFEGNINIRLHISKVFNDDDYLKMFDFIKHIRSMNINPSELVFWFQIEKGNKTKEFIKDFIYFDLYGEDFKKIRDKTDLLKFKR
jgi:hypothetical protein